MHLKFLGTAAAEGWPGLFCACSVCKRARIEGGKNIRSRSSLLIDGTVKIDFPPDTFYHVVMQGLDMTRVRHILFTHRHDDHFAPMDMDYARAPFAAVPLPHRISILAPADLIDELAERVELAKLPYDTECMEPGVTVKRDDWSFTPIPANHAHDLICYNYVIENKNSSMLFASDTGWYDEASWKLLAGRQLTCAVIECTLGAQESDYAGHLSIDGIIEMRKRLLSEGSLRPGGRVIATHFSHNGGLLHQELEATLNPQGIEVAYDGFETDI